jgi:hypothetical protein
MSGMLDMYKFDGMDSLVHVMWWNAWLNSPSSEKLMYTCPVIYRCCITNFHSNAVDLLVVFSFCLQNNFLLVWSLSQHYLNIRIVLLEKPCLHSSKFMSTQLRNLWSPSQLIWCYVIFVLDIEIFNNVIFDQLHGRSAVVALTAILSTTAVMACPSRCRLSMW